MKPQVKSPKKKRKMLLILLLTPIALGAALWIYLLAMSPGTPRQFTDAEGKTLSGSLSEKIMVDVGGVKQGMFIRSKDVNKPVLLFLHGGPGFPNYFLFEKFEPGLEDLFTVCYWEQRGGGLSYSAHVTPESMTLAQLTSDDIEVTNYLRGRFKQQKIYIMAWSGGTPIALSAVAKAPELFHAYMAMGQITRQHESEQIAYDYMLSHFRGQDDQKSVDALLKYNHLATEADLVSFYNSATRDNLMHRIGIGTMRNMKSVMKGIFLPVWTCRAYTLGEKFRIWKSKIFFLPGTQLKKEAFTTDFFKGVPKIEVPIYFFCGKYDLTVNIDLTREYYDYLDAPLKGFYTFQESAHAPLFEEPDLAMDVIASDVLNHAISLADISNNPNK